MRSSYCLQLNLKYQNWPIMMLIHESHVFEMRIEMKFEVCDMVFNTIYVVRKKS